MNNIGKLCMAAILCMACANVAYADYAYSKVLIGVSTSKSFQVTLNGQSATNSDPAMPGTATGVIWFNSTDGNSKYVNASVAGANAQVADYPACTTPIAVFKNTGTVVETLSIMLNNTVTGMVFFYNASNATGSMTGTVNSSTVNTFNGAGSTFVVGLGITNSTNMCIWANFSNVNGGQYQTQFNYSSA